MGHQEYLRHQKGLTLLWLWMDQWKDSDGWVFEDNELKLSQLVSQRFCFGLPKVKNTKSKSYEMFLGVQHDELQWMKRIPWDRFVLDRSPSLQSKYSPAVLWMISSPHTSPDRAWPDLPSLAIGLKLNYDMDQAFDQWGGRRMDWRSVWWDDENTSYVGNVPLGQISLAVGDIKEKWTQNQRDNIRSLKDIVLQRLEETSVPFDPGFSGDLADLSKEQREMIDPFKEKDKNYAIEKDYPEIFGQFLEEQPQDKKKQDKKKK